MKQFELDQALNSGNLPQAIMLYGESHFLIDYYAKAISDRYGDADLLSLYHHEYHFPTAKAHLSQGSLFGGASVVVIKNEKKVPKKELDELLELIGKNPTACLIYCYYGDDFKNSHTAFRKTKLKDSVRLFPPFLKNAIPLMAAHAQKLGVRIDSYTLTHLYNSQNGDLALSVNELEKFAILDRQITPQDVNDLVYSLAEVRLDQVINDLLQKKAYIPNLEKLLEAGEEPIQIITAISGYLTVIVRFLIHMKLHANANSVEILGYKLPPQIEKERAALAKRFKLETLRQMLTHLLESELALKTAKAGSKEPLLFASLLRLQKFL